MKKFAWPEMELHTMASEEIMVDLSWIPDEDYDAGED